MDVIGVGPGFPGVRSENAAEVRLPKLIPAPGRSSAKLDSTGPKQLHYAITQGVIGLLENQSESIIRASFEYEIGLIEVGIEVAEEKLQVRRPLTISLV